MDIGRPAALAIHRLTLAVVTAVPEQHPDFATFQPFPVHAWVIDHPDGAILVDTGIGSGHAMIDAWYRPRITSLDDALAGIGKARRDIAAVVLSHLHFDHCGQQNALDAPVHVQAAEVAAAREPRYTVPEWARIADERLRLVDGDADIAEGVSVVATPGHTPGHQSVVVNAGNRTVVLAAQCAYRTHELYSGIPDRRNLHGDEWQADARDSLARIRALAPAQVHLSHDAAIVRFA
jgi:N-acyl homoserine lactone hydrolase